MARYDKVYELLAQRAIDSATIDIEAFVSRAQVGGVRLEALTEMLVNDFETGGPLFGRYMRNLTGASSASVRTAIRQGEAVGAMRYDPAIRKQVAADAAASEELLSLQQMDDVLDGANAEELDAIEEQGASVDETWIATLVNTCHRCLPLHGITRTRRQWKQLGLHPDTIHGDWNSECKCAFVVASQTTGRADITEPLRRAPLPKEERALGRKTARVITQANLDKSRAAAEAAMQTADGRRIMKILGQVGDDGLE